MAPGLNATPVTSKSSKNAAESAGNISFFANNTSMREYNIVSLHLSSLEFSVSLTVKVHHESLLPMPKF